MRQRLRFSHVTCFFALWQRGCTSFLILAFCSFFVSFAQAVTPSGTVINNLATLQYQVNAVNMASLNSNTDSFTVLGLASFNQGHVIAQGLDNRYLFSGDTLTFDIELKNDGSNGLDSGELSIRLAESFTFSITDPRATWLSQQTVNGFTTYLYSVDDLAIAGNTTYAATVSLPASASVSALDSTLTTLHYQANGVEIDQTDSTLNVSDRTEGVLQLLQYSADSDAIALSVQPTEFLQSNGSYAPIPPPVLGALGGVAVTSTPIPVKPATRFTHKQIVFVKLEEGDHNLDRTVQETVEVDFNLFDSGETERLKLLETDVNSGVFTGYITLDLDDAVTTHDGVLSVENNARIQVNYTDDIDNTDTSSQIILVDPFGILFDSSTGALLDGYTVSMINADTGQPAQVFGDDGISTYPASVITGGRVTDSGGTVYNFTEGAYRFPFAPLGHYKLVVTPPEDSDYKWPSRQSTVLINQLPSAPYVIVLGSRGETFPLQDGPPLQIDIPLDRSNAPLYIRRTASIKQVAPGDFIRFTVEIENTDKVAINNVILTETLPQGFRLEEASLRLDDNVILPLTMSKTGQTFTLNLNNMNAGASLALEYVAAIGAVNRGMVSSISAAQGNNGATSSNTAMVKTLVTEELMRSRSILMGQVIVSGKQGEGEKNVSSLKGIRIYLEDGRYAITDERGMYHFDNIVPGLHVVQLDLDTLPPQYEAVLTENNTRFAGRAWSQFVDVQGGTLWRSDFYVAEKPKPQGELSLKIENSALLEDDQLQYRVTLNTTGVSITNKRLTVMIPPYMTYQVGSTTFQNTPVSDPEITKNMLTFRLKDTFDQDKEIVTFKARGVSNSPTSEMISKALMVFNTPDKHNQRTPVVTHTRMIETTKSVQHVTEKMALGIRFGSADDQITVSDKRILTEFAEKIKGLKNLRIHAVGHSDNRRLLPKAKLRFKDNQHLSKNRATVIANALRDLLKLPPSDVTVKGRGADEPIADNTTPEGQRENRRVHLYIYSDKETFQTTPDSLAAQNSESVTVTTQGSLLPSPDEFETEISPPPVNVSDFNSPWLAQQTTEVEWIYPPKDILPSIASTNIVVKHPRSQRIHLVQNGQPVETFNFEGTLKHDNGAAISTWRGVDLTPGDNHFEVIVVNKQGDELQRLSHHIHFSTAPVTAELVKQDAILVADGIQNPVIAIRLLDASGYPVRNGVRGSFKISPPYQAIRPTFNTESMMDALPERHEYHVTQDGIALITLEPTTESGEVTLELPLANDRTVTLKPKLIAQSTSWVLVGLAEGTLGYQTLKDNRIALTDKQTESELYQDNRVAFFAKGQIQGKWLMTLAYDSAKKRPNQTDPELFQTIDPDTYYTIYGDTSYNGSAAPSSENLYLKLEKDQFYFLFGDYRTDLNKTQLSKYNRTLTGIKSRYQDEHYDVIVFASRTNQAFVKDEFRGKGVTGPYFLTRNNIAMNSEKITIEVRDRWRSENILSTTELTRHQDYQIDYQTGEIYFRTPTYSTDFDLNPQYIIVTYESFDSGESQLTYGGHAQATVNDKLTLGVSHINEGRTGGEARLDGLDVTYQATKAIKLSVEAAQTTDDNVTQTRASGSSYLAEVAHQTTTSQSKLYIRDQEQGFGLGQTNASENGLRKIGLDTNVKIHENLNVKGHAYQQTSSDMTREVLEVEGRSRFEKTEFNMGTRIVSDERKLEPNESTQQLTAGVRHHFMDNKLTTRLQREQNVTRDKNRDFPNRTRLGADYRVTPKISLFIEQDITDGALHNTRNTLAGVKASPWNGGELYSGVTQSTGTQGQSLSSNISGRQTWQLNKQWRLQLGAEEVKVLDANVSDVQQQETPFVDGIADEFTAASMGVTYAPEDWMWSVRAETRNGSREDRWRLATSLQTHPNTRLSTLTTLAFSNSQRNGQLTKESAIRLGLAYRPLVTSEQAMTGSWLFLNKLDLKRRDVNGGTPAGNDWRIINNLNANYKQNRWQLALQYGLKTVNETINGTNYDSVTDLIGIETRYDVTPKWDLGLHGNVLRSVSLNQSDYNTGFSVGRTVSDNIWVSVGYNLTGFYDEDFSRSRYTTQGPFIRFRMKVDQQSAKELINWAGL